MLVVDMDVERYGRALRGDVVVAVVCFLVTHQAQSVPDRMYLLIIETTRPALMPSRSSPI